MVAELLNRKVVRVPEVTGFTLEKARILMEDAGLGKLVVLFREGYEDPDTVVDQRQVYAGRYFFQLAVDEDRGVGSSVTHDIGDKLFDDYRQPSGKFIVDGFLARKLMGGLYRTHDRDLLVVPSLVRD